jgi:hypothetical protein
VLACSGSTLLIAQRFQDQFDAHGLWHTIKDRMTRVDQTTLDLAKEAIWDISFPTDGTICDRIELFFSSIQAAIYKVHCNDPGWQPSTDTLKRFILRRLPEELNIAKVILSGETDLILLRTKLLALAAGLSGAPGTMGASGHSATGSVDRGDTRDGNRDSSKRSLSSTRDSPPPWWRNRPDRKFLKPTDTCPLVGHSHNLGDCHTRGKCPDCGLFGAGGGSGFPSHRGSCKHKSASTSTSTTATGNTASPATSPDESSIPVTRHSADGTKVKIDGHWFAKVSAISAAALTSTHGMNF